MKLLRNSCQIPTKYKYFKLFLKMTDYSNKNSKTDVFTWEDTCERYDSE